MISKETKSEENSYQSVYDCELSNEFINAPVSESTKAAFYIYGKLKETVETIFAYYKSYLFNGEISNDLCSEICDAANPLEDFVLNMITESIRERAAYKDEVKM